MDAISFVLGIKSSHLRSTHLRELIYRGRVLRTSTINGEANGVNGHVNGDTNGDVSGTHERQDPKSAWVSAVYEDDAGDEQKWKRTITNQGVSEYRINDRVVTAQQYNESLEAENILIKARNFLVFQGDVEAIAIQKPTDLTRLIEQVSGSLEYKADYDRLKTELDEASDQQTFQMNRRRGMNAELRQYQEQKKEAENYKRKAEERDAAIVTHVLWKLYHLQKQIEESSAEIQTHQTGLKDFRRGMETYEKDLDKAKKEYATAGRAVGKAESAIKAKDREIDGKRGSLVPIDEKIEVSTKALTKYANRVNTIAKERGSQNNSIKQLEKDLKVVEKAEAQWNAEWDQTKNKQGDQLNDQALQQYNKLREEVNKQSSADQSKVDDLKRQRAGLESTVNSLKGNVESAQWKLQAAESELASITDRQTAAKEIVDKTKAEIDQKRKDLNALVSRRMQAARTRTELNEKLEEVLRKLIDADDGRKQSEKEIRVRETVSALKRTYPGVRGRVNELCKPKQKKYADAVSTVLGRHFDAIVVDTETTAKQCIEYLRDQRSGQATFIPLDTIQVNAVPSNLRGMHKGMRPAIETVDFDSSISRAIQYACGNSIVCDDLDIAKYLCYERNVDAKAVTLDGTVISKGGLITGGRGKEQQSRWEDAEVEKYHKLKDKLLADLNALPPERGRVVEEETLQGDLSALENRHRFTSEEVAGLTKNLISKKKEVDHAKIELKEAKPKHESERKKLQELDDDLEEYQEAVSKVEDDVFANFCQQHGFDSIRDYEARQGSLQQEAAQKKLEFTTHKSRIQNQLNFEKTRLQGTDDRILSLRDKEQRDRTTIDELNEEREGVQNDLDTLNAQLEELEEIRDEETEKHQKASQKLDATRQDVQARSKKMDGVLKAISSIEGEMQRHSSNRYTLLRKCKIENINLPLAQSSDKLDALPINDLPGDEGDTMDVDDEDPSSSALQAHTVTDYGIHPDFEELTDDMKEESDEAMDGELQKEIDELESALEKMAPNMHAGERLETVETRVRDTQKEFDDTAKRYRQTKKAFEDVEQKRNDLFNKAFNHISEQIEPIYADLTKSAEYTAGGRAYLTADTEEPYLAGVHYHTMPPAKRFRDMEHLSGGEKTMAALALLFSIHSYQPSPFFVLDEVDAALDNANVAKLVNYVREHAVSPAFDNPVAVSQMHEPEANVTFRRVLVCSSLSSASRQASSKVARRSWESTAIKEPTALRS